MTALLQLASTLNARRQAVATVCVVGALVVALCMVLVPSQLGFVLAGPLLICPWALLCIAFAKTPSTMSLGFFAALAAVGLAWPLIYL